MVDMIGPSEHAKVYGAVSADKKRTSRYLHTYSRFVLRLVFGLL